MITCPRGCDAEMEYIGIDTDQAEMGRSTCDVYECPTCGCQVLSDCISDDEFEEYEDFDNENQ